MFKSICCDSNIFFIWLTKLFDVLDDVDEDDSDDVELIACDWTSDLGEEDINKADVDEQGEFDEEEEGDTCK